MYICLHKRQTNIMKLTEKAIAAISTREIVLKLALALGFTEVWIHRLIQKNKENGDLTTAAALKVISEETGLSQVEILEESVTTQI